MGTLISGWSRLGFLARVAIVILTGVTWAASSLQQVIVPPDYVNAVTVADFFAVYAYSTAWLLTAASLLILREVAPSAPRLPTAILVVAAACVLAGVANGFEDGLRIREFGLLYVIGAIVGGLGMLVIAAMLWASSARRLTFVPGVGSIAMMAVMIGGGVLGLVAWLGFAVILSRERLSLRATPSAA